jgi:hypothetical protein
MGGCPKVRLTAANAVNNLGGTGHAHDRGLTFMRYPDGRMLTPCYGTSE